MDAPEPQSFAGKKAEDLTSGPIVRTMVIFSLPVLGSHIVQSINGSINAVWVGKFLGEKGLAATANANIVMFLIFSVVFGFGMACTILVGHHMGRRDMDNVRRTVGTGLTMFVIMGFAAVFIGWFGAPIILHLLSTPADIFPMALTYLRVLFVGLPFSLLTIFLSMSIRGAGDALTPMLLMLPGMVIDVALNPVFILGLGPAPELGIMGAALATLAANLVSFVLMITMIYKRDLPIRLRGAEFRYLRLDKEIVSVIVRKGVPMGMQMIVMTGSALVMMALINHRGTDTVAAYGAANQVWTYIQMPAIAVGMTVSTMAAQNIGAGRWDRINDIARAGLVVNIAMTGAIVLVIALLSYPVLGLFLPPHGNSIHIAHHISLVASWSFILVGAVAILTGVMRANGVSITPMVIMFLAYIPGRLGSALALQSWFGPNEIWWSFAFGAAVSLVLTAAFYVHGGWRKGAMIATKEGAQEFVQAEAEPAGRATPNG